MSDGYYRINIINDIEIEIHARDIKKIFELLTECFLKLLVESSYPEKTIREVNLEFDSVEYLFVDYFNELIYLFDRDGFVPVRIDFSMLNNLFSAKLYGFLVKNEPVKRILKSATYHELEFKKNGGYYLKMIVDI